MNVHELNFIRVIVIKQVEGHLSPNTKLQMKKAFTLIELLVVIAIIAILAAILFPVFAQAKAAAKKISSVSNLKQVGTATHIYLADYDDVMPITYTPMPGNPTRYNYDRLTPAGNWLVSTDPVINASIQGFWANNTQPYIKNYQLLSDPNGQKIGGQTSSPYPGFIPPSGAPAISYTYNGLLNSYSHTSIAAVSQLPVLWNGRGRATIEGWAYANPYMGCATAAAPCVYQPPAAGCSFSNNGSLSRASTNSRNTGYDLHSGGIIYTYADSHAKWIKIGVKSTGATDPTKDPFTDYAGTNEPNARWQDATGCHSFQFRPDYDFSTQTAVALP